MISHVLIERERAVVALRFISEPALLSHIARHLGVEYVELGSRQFAPEVLRTLPEKFIRTRNVLPIALSRESHRGPLKVATSDPGNLTLLDEIAFITRKSVTPVLASERDIEQAIAVHFGTATTSPASDGATHRRVSPRLSR